MKSKDAFKKENKISRAERIENKTNPEPKLVEAEQSREDIGHMLGHDLTDAEKARMGRIREKDREYPRNTERRK